MTEKQEQKLNELMRHWWNGNLTDARAQVRKLTKRDLTQLLINQHQLANGAWSQENVVKLQDFVADALS